MQRRGSRKGAKEARKGRKEKKEYGLAPDRLRCIAVLLTIYQDAMNRVSTYD